MKTDESIPVGTSPFAPAKAVTARGAKGDACFRAKSKQS